MKEKLLSHAGSRISTLTNVALAVCALAVTGVVVRREFFGPSRLAAAVPVRQVANWEAFAATGHRTGPADAPVRIVVFSDFQCPACLALAGELAALRLEFPSQVAIVHRHFPLPIHPFAAAAARASECAAQQGRFDAFHDALFSAQGSIGLLPWTRFADEAGVGDLPRFEACVSDPATARIVDRDVRDAAGLDVQATPTFLVNDLRVTGTPPLDTLRAYVRRALRERAARPGVASRPQPLPETGA